MFYFLHPFTDISIIFNLFRYITFRSAGASVMAFFLCLWLGPFIIRWLKDVNATSHQRREFADSIHKFLSA